MNTPVELSVVIPVYNNAASLLDLVARLIKNLETSFSKFEIIFINDGSRDDSLLILKKLATGVPSIKIIDLSKNFGQHPAICAGFEHASGDVIVLMDADLQDSPEKISDLVSKLHSDSADIVYTVKKSNVQKVTTRFTSVFYFYLFSNIVKAKVPLNIGTFRAFNRKFLEAILQFREVNVLYGPLMFYMGFKSVFLDLPFNDRPNGRSSYTFKKRLQLAVNSLMSYTDIPHRLSMGFGVILLLASLLYGLLVVLQYFLFGASLPGGLTLLLIVLCLGIGSIMITLGIIGSYLFRVYQEVLNRPRYLIREKINFF